jgi:RNA-directed DNA polymerase
MRVPALFQLACEADDTRSTSPQQVRYHVTDLWRRTLKRRSQKDRTTWARITRLAEDYLPAARILHPWLDTRFAVNHQRWEPSA